MYIDIVYYMFVAEPHHNLRLKRINVGPFVLNECKQVFNKKKK